MILYVDYIGGNDGTGDGTSGNPYKTIPVAITAGGTDIRVAKSPDNTPLTGTLRFTNGIADVLGIGTLFTTELAVNDFIVGPYGFWYRVASITDDTHMALTGGPSLQYPQAYTYIDVISEKVNYITNAESGNWQEITGSGVSESSKLLVSGGWDLGSETQTGVTNVGDPNALASNGIYINEKQFITVSKFGLLGFGGNGVYVANTTVEQFIDVNDFNVIGGSNGLFIHGGRIYSENFTMSFNQFYQENSVQTHHNHIKNMRIAQGNCLVGESRFLTIDGLLIIGGGLSGGTYLDVDSHWSYSFKNKFRNLRIYNSGGSGINWQGGHDDSFEYVESMFHSDKGIIFQSEISSLYMSNIKASHNNNHGIQWYGVKAGTFGKIEACYNGGSGLAISGGVDSALKFGDVTLIGNVQRPLDFQIENYEHGYSVSFEKFITGGSFSEIRGIAGTNGQTDWTNGLDTVNLIGLDYFRERIKVGDFILDPDTNFSEVIAINSRTQVQIASSYTGTTGTTPANVRRLSNERPFINETSGGNYSINIDQPMKCGIHISNFQGTGKAENFFLYGATRQNTTVPRGGTGSCLEFEPYSKRCTLEHSFFVKGLSNVGKNISIYARKDSDFNGKIEMSVRHAQNRLVDWVDITPTATDTYELKTVQVAPLQVTSDSVYEVCVRVKDCDWGKVFVDDIAISALTGIHVGAIDMSLSAIIEYVIGDVVPDNSDYITLIEYANLGLNPFNLINGSQIGWAVLASASSQYFQANNYGSGYQAGGSPFTVDGVASIERGFTGKKTIFGSDNGNNFGFDHDTNQLFMQIASNGFLYSVAFEPNWGSEQHFSWVRGASNTYFFVDGALIGTVGANSDSYNTTYKTIGRGGSGTSKCWDGKIRWVRIQSGETWNADFTVPDYADALASASEELWYMDFVSQDAIDARATDTMYASGAPVIEKDTNPVSRIKSNEAVTLSIV